MQKTERSLALPNITITRISKSGRYKMKFWLELNASHISIVDSSIMQLCSSIYSQYDTYLARKSQSVVALQVWGETHPGVLPPKQPGLHSHALQPCLHACLLVCPHCQDCLEHHCYRACKGHPGRWRLICPPPPPLAREATTQLICKSLEEANNTQHLIHWLVCLAWNLRGTWEWNFAAYSEGQLQKLRDLIFCENKSYWAPSHGGSCEGYLVLKGICQFARSTSSTTFKEPFRFLTAITDDIESI